MILDKILWFIAFVGVVHSQGPTDLPIMPRTCALDDKQCVAEGTANFFKLTAQGLPKYGFLQIDPFIIPFLDVVVNQDLIIRLRNIVVTGLRNQRMLDFMMNPYTRKSFIKLLADKLDITGIIYIEFTRTRKRFSGFYTAKASVIGTTPYDFRFVDDNNFEYFDITPSPTQCEILNVDFSLNVELQNVLDNDAEGRRLRADYQEALRTQAVYTILRIAHSAVEHNIRASYRLFPKSYFFSGV